MLPQNVLSKPQILSPIEKPVVFVPQPIASQRSSVHGTTPTASQPIQMSGMNLPSAVGVQRNNIQSTAINPVMEPITSQQTMQPPPVIRMQPGGASVMMHPITAVTLPVLQQQQQQRRISGGTPVMMHSAATPQPINSHRSSVQLSVTPRASVAMTGPSLSVPRPISSITSVMSTKSATEGAMPFKHTVTPIPAKLITAPQPPKLTNKAHPLPPSSSSMPSAVPIVSSNIPVQIVPNRNLVTNPMSLGASTITPTSSITNARITTSQVCVCMHVCTHVFVSVCVSE